MKTQFQTEIVKVSGAGDWSPAMVLAMDVYLLTQPDLDVQCWFEEQVALHLGCSPHGARVDPSPIVRVMKNEATSHRSAGIRRPTS